MLLALLCCWHCCAGWRCWRHLLLLALLCWLALLAPLCCWCCFAAVRVSEAPAACALPVEACTSTTPCVHAVLWLPQDLEGFHTHLCKRPICHMGMQVC